MTDLCRKYYVDSINGSDTNDGLSENSAFASLFAIHNFQLQSASALFRCHESVKTVFQQHFHTQAICDPPVLVQAY